MQEVPDTERSLRMFLCVVVDALYRGGDVTDLTSLWDSLSTTDVSYGSLFGGGCRNEDVVVSICLMSYMFACFTCFKVLIELHNMRELVEVLNGFFEDLFGCSDTNW